MPVTPYTGKLQGQRSQFTYLAPGGTGSQVQLKSLQDFDIEISAKEIDASDHDSQGWEDRLLGLANWKGTIKGVYFEGDATQQGVFNALVAGLEGNGNIACTFFPQKGTAGDGSLSYTGTAVVTGWKHGAPMNGTQTIDITVSGRGALTITPQ